MRIIRFDVAKRTLDAVGREGQKRSPAEESRARGAEMQKYREAGDRCASAAVPGFLTGKSMVIVVPTYGKGAGEIKWENKEKHFLNSSLFPYSK